ELIGRSDRTPADDRSGDPPRSRLLTEPVDQIGQLPLGEPVDEVRGAWPRHCCTPLAHPHVERSVHAVPEPAVRTVELHRGDPEIEEHTVDRAADDILVDLGEACSHQPYA